MKIFQVIPTLLEGGAERFVVDLCNTLTENYPCQIVLVVFFRMDKNIFLSRELNPAVEIIELDKQLGLDIKVVKKLNRLVNEHRPDVIHTHLNTFEYMFFTLLSHRKHINFINTIHNSPDRIYNNWLVRIIGSVMYRFRNVFPVIISTDSILEFKKYFPAVKPVLIFNGRPLVRLSNKIDAVQKEVDSYRLTRDTLVFINVARISPQKNQLMLVEAFNQLISEGKDVVLLIAGMPWDKNILEKLNAVIGQRIHLLGYKDNATDYLKCADAFCLSSFYEGMPISLIEATQYGIVPICTPAGGTKDIIDPSIGFMSEDYSVESYVNSLKAFLELSDEQRKAMSMNGISAYNSRFTMQITASKYYELYRAVDK